MIFLREHSFNANHKKLFKIPCPNITKNKRIEYVYTDSIDFISLNDEQKCDVNVKDFQTSFNIKT